MIKLFANSIFAILAIFVLPTSLPDLNIPLSLIEKYFWLPIVELITSCTVAVSSSVPCAIGQSTKDDDKELLGKMQVGTVNVVISWQHTLN